MIRTGVTRADLIAESDCNGKDEAEVMRFSATIGG